MTQAYNPNRYYNLRIKSLAQTVAKEKEISLYDLAILIQSRYPLRKLQVILMALKGGPITQELGNILKHELRQHLKKEVLDFEMLDHLNLPKLTRNNRWDMRVKGAGVVPQ
ncbi:MAG: hypothetical protein AAF990_03470 [Bacteroidota bacterium]